MAQFVVKNPNVYATISGVVAVVKAMENGKENRIEILKANNIDLSKSDWFLLKDWLSAFKTISEQLGNMNLFIIGKTLTETVPFPPMKDLEEALRTIDVAYHMSHRLDGKIMFDGATGKMTEGIGNYKLTVFNEQERKAVMVCDNPYPSEFDRGIITQVVRKFKPKGSREDVVLDKSKESRLNGAETCTYNISW